MAKPSSSEKLRMLSENGSLHTGVGETLHSNTPGPAVTNSHWPTLTLSMSNTKLMVRPNQRSRLDRGVTGSDLVSLHHSRGGNLQVHVYLPFFIGTRGVTALTYAHGSRTQNAEPRPNTLETVIVAPSARRWILRSINRDRLHLLTTCLVNPIESVKDVREILFGDRAALD